MFDECAPCSFRVTFFPDLVKPRYESVLCGRGVCVLLPLLVIARGFDNRGQQVYKNVK